MEQTISIASRADKKKAKVLEWVLNSEDFWGKSLMGIYIKEQKKMNNRRNKQVGK